MRRFTSNVKPFFSLKTQKVKMLSAIALINALWLLLFQQLHVNLSKRNTPKIPKYYFFGDRLNKISHTRLRTECNTLKFHLYRRNLIPEPYCTCGAVENTSHFLFICPKIYAIRRELLHIVSNYVEPSKAVLSFGDDLLSDESNEVIFRAVHTCKYIQTKRFSSNE